MKQLSVGVRVSNEIYHGWGLGLVTKMQQFFPVGFFLKKLKIGKGIRTKTRANTIIF